MEKGIYIKNDEELNYIETELMKKDISIYNIFFDNNKKMLCWFENEDYQNTGMGFNLKEGV